MSAMDLIKSMMVAASGLKAQSGRMRVIAENIANADSTSRVAGGDPYRRKIVTFEDKLNREIGANTVSLGRPVLDKTEFQLKYMPGHPAADEAGYVKMPNVNGMVEAMDMREAQRSYEANLNLIQASRRMISQTIDILRK
ncbi:flagellar basal-body rod protein FlgC [Parvibaculum lavamentivorans DS-1]|uniref:Flagellar basal-body rod protein FlgC n=2 Tax=Parvibaculum lavamentivorans TaxID=256618 RepID=A7HW97_PARL1|nr:flagellar basal-body rod protein FlgC [Parvibaculum lavamentivorans DS-1]